MPDSATRALKRNGSVECWGDCTDRQCTPPSGALISASPEVGYTADYTATPPVGQVASVNACYRRTCGNCRDDRIECWGLEVRGRRYRPCPERSFGRPIRTTGIGGVAV